MKNWKNIFVGFLSAAVVAVLAVPTWAATSDGCDVDGNNMITPELALCSTHAYNIGVIENPSDSGERAFMQEIIAMKTTLITQQMYRQYEQMESMLNRLKTQLEKAVLTNDLKVASGKAGEEDGGGYSGDDVNVAAGTFIVGAQDCRNKYNVGEALDCYKSNLGAIQQYSAYGKNPTTELKKQLIKDFFDLAELMVGSGEKLECTSSVTGLTRASKPKDLKNKDFATLVGDMQVCLRNGYVKYEKAQADLKKKDD